MIIFFSYQVRYGFRLFRRRSRFLGSVLHDKLHASITHFRNRLTLPVHSYQKRQRREIENPRKRWNRQQKSFRRFSVTT